MKLRETNEEMIDDDLFALACGPDFRSGNTHHALSMGFGLTQLTVKRIRRHKIVE